MPKAWSSIEDVPYCFARSYVKFQGHTAKKMIEFDPNWAFPDCNSSLNSPMAMKCCTKLETAKERCPIVFQGHQSNFKVTWDKTSPILTQIGHFRTIGRSQLSNPSDLPCCGLGTLQDLNSLWPSDAIRRQGTESTLAEVLACCLTAPSHYLNQCWLIISKVLWHSSKGIIMRRFEDTNQ